MITDYLGQLTARALRVAVVAAWPAVGAALTLELPLNHALGVYAISVWAHWVSNPGAQTQQKETP